MTNQVRVGIAGLGRSGWGIHANALVQLPDFFTVVAVCDPDESRQAEAKARFNCKTYSDYIDLVADDEVQLMVVATPSQLHRDDSIAAMQAGKHVIVEKPMAPSLAEVDDMIAASKETGRLLTVNQNYRYHPDFLKIKEVVQSGILGRILQMRMANHGFSRRWDWQTLKRYGGGILNNHGAHTIDWALQLIDDPEPEVIAFMETTPLYAGDAESHVKLLIRPQQGPLIDIELTHANAFPQENCLIMGTQGSLTSDRKTVHWKYFKPEDTAPLVLDTKPTPDRSYNRETLPWQEETYQPYSNFGSNMGKLYGDLHATICQGKDLVITPESVRRQVLVLEKCRQQSPVYSD